MDVLYKYLTYSAKRCNNYAYNFVHSPATNRGDLVRRKLTVGQDELMPAKEYKKRARAYHRRERRIALNSAAVTTPLQPISVTVNGDPQSSKPRQSMDPDRLWEPRSWSRFGAYQQPVTHRQQAQGVRGHTRPHIVRRSHPRGPRVEWRHHREPAGPVNDLSPGTPVYVRQVVVNDDLPEGNPRRVEVRDYIRPWQA